MILLGMYRETFGRNNYPSIYDVISEIPHKNKAEILHYLKSGKVQAAAPGSLTDKISGRMIPGEMTFMTDGEYAWRSDLAYYVEKYNVKLPEDFVKRAVVQ